MKLHSMMPFGEFFWRFERDIKSETIHYINKHMGGCADGDAINFLLHDPSSYLQSSDGFIGQVKEDEHGSYIEVKPSFFREQDKADLKSLIPLKRFQERLKAIKGTEEEWQAEELLPDYVIVAVRKKHRVPPLCSDIYYVRSLDNADLLLYSHMVDKLYPEAKTEYFDRINEGPFDLDEILSQL